ncbi:RHS repeat domain-containing protein [Christiangramia marina]|uniref:RHS repeat domain-containing protein n=1 Tax=Christiangramia marina TaxID=409436 RepID=UPI003AA9BC36
MAMPGRNTEGDYRYAYQGQEKDPETGKEAFELRLWDSRIRRWLTTDPCNQHNSPYLRMGNDPVNGIDPDGGYKTRAGAILGWIGGGFKGFFLKSDDPKTKYHKFGIKGSSIENGVNVFNVNFGNISEKLRKNGGVVNSQGAWFLLHKLVRLDFLVKLNFFKKRNLLILGKV